jgi:hypothetical protein
MSGIVDTNRAALFVVSCVSTVLQAVHDSVWSCGTHLAMILLRT